MFEKYYNLVVYNIYVIFLLMDVIIYYWLGLYERYVYLFYGLNVIVLFDMVVDIY